MPEGSERGQQRLERVVVVLVTPRDATNVGGVVRVMGNFGLSHLRLVEPAAFDAGRALAVAHRGAAVVQAMTRHPSLADALSDCGLAVATSARVREVRHAKFAPWQTAGALLEAARGAPAALVFGPEDNGLSNEDLALCHAVSVIPTAPADWSLNLAQATLVHAYELWLAAYGQRPAGDGPHDVARPPGRKALLAQALRDGAEEGPPLALGADREAMFGALESMLWAMHPHNNPGRVTAALGRLRALLLRGAPRTEEARLLTAIFQHVAHALGRQPPGEPPDR